MASMKLAHYSPEIITRVRSRRQGGKRWTAMKPTGLWVSDESRGAYGWLQWCRDNNFGGYRMRYKHEVKLAPDAKILYLRNHKDIDDFANEYRADSDINRIMEKTAAESPYFRESTIMEIDWGRVAKKYQGIIITPYIWSQRMGRHMWYYGWDCASGCIWNARAIESITMVRERKVPRKPTAWQAKRKHKRTMDNLRAINERLQADIEKRDREKVAENA